MTEEEIRELSWLMWAGRITNYSPTPTERDALREVRRRRGWARRQHRRQMIFWQLVALSEGLYRG